MAHWFAEYMRSDLYRSERALQQTMETQRAGMESLLIELAQIMEVPTAPAGYNGLFRGEDFLARARELVGHE